MSEQPKIKSRFVVCIRNDGYEVDLELDEVYEMLPDPRWEARGFVRVIDGSGEDYVYPQRYFARPEPAQHATGGDAARVLAPGETREFTW
jgi:hypothetical protein